jgi:predicted Zn-dependent protease
MTHPPAADRVTRLQEVIAAAQAPGATTTNAAALEQHLDGIVFGDSREKGIVRGNQFFHPVLGFALQFPNGWEIMNTDEQVTAVENENANVGIVLQLAEGTGSLEQTARSRMNAAGFRELNGGRETINGLPAYVGTYQGASNGNTLVVRAAHIQASDRTYLLAGLATPNDFNRVDNAFDATILSFRPLRGAEAEAIQPNRVDFYGVRGGDTWESIAARSGGAIKASTLAIMNGSSPTTPPRAGERIRVIVGG